MTASSSAKEISLKNALQALIDDAETLADVKLRGSDGVLIPAHRNMLAARSPVFRAMFYGPFEEATNDVVDIAAYAGEVLKYLVEYICTNNSRVLKDDFETNAATIVALAAAANYFELPCLADKAKDKAADMMKQSPQLSAAFLIECLSRAGAHDSGAVERVQSDALSVIRHNPEVLAHKGAQSLALLNQAHLEKLVRADTLKDEAFAKFMAIFSWSKVDDGGIKDNETAADDETSNGYGGRKRKAILLLSDHVELAKINPTKLRSTVKSSGLVTREQLCDVYETQAVKYVKQSGFPCRLPVWTISRECTLSYAHIRGHDEMSLLECQPMRLGGGNYRWSFKIEDQDDTLGDSYEVLYLGVCLPDTNLCSPFNEGTYCYGSDGVLHINGENDDYHGFGTGLGWFHKSDTINFSLDLALGGSGKLCASVNDKPFVVLSEDVLVPFQKKRRDESRSFVPFTSIRPPHRVRFLGFE